MLIYGRFEDQVPKLTDGSVDLIIFDPPYGIGNARLELKSRDWKKTAEDWDTFKSVDQQYSFYLQSLNILLPKLKPSGSLFVFGSHHCIFLLGEILQRHLSCEFINTIVWNKINAMFRVTRSGLIEGTEYILWARRIKNKHYFDYDYACGLNFGRQLRNVWNSPILQNDEALPHPHQKPSWLIQRLVRIACPPGGTVLDPMAGSGTTEVVCRYEKLNSFSIECNSDYFELANKRIKLECRDLF